MYVLVRHKPFRFTKTHNQNQEHKNEQRKIIIGERFYT